MYVSQVAAGRARELQRRARNHSRGGENAEWLGERLAEQGAELPRELILLLLRDLLLPRLLREHFLNELHLGHADLLAEQLVRCVRMPVLVYGVVFSEQLLDLEVLGGLIRIDLFLVQDVGLGPALQKQLHDLVVIVLSCKMEGRVQFAVLRVEVHLVLDQQLHGVKTTLEGRNVNRRAVETRQRLDVGLVL